MEINDSINIAPLQNIEGSVEGSTGRGQGCRDYPATDAKSLVNWRRWFPGGTEHRPWISSVIPSPPATKSVFFCQSHKDYSSKVGWFSRNHRRPFIIEQTSTPLCSTRPRVQPNLDLSQVVRDASYLRRREWGWRAFRFIVSEGFLS